MEKYNKTTYDTIKDKVGSKIFFQFFSDYTKYLASIPDEVNYITKNIDNWFMVEITEQKGNRPMEIAHIIITGINLGSLVLISTIIAIGLYRVFMQ